MGDVRSRFDRRRYRRRHRLRADSRAVVSVVGTLLALLVFLSLFGIFIEEWLPLWMTDNEAQFTAETQASLAELKSNMDLQTILNGPAVYATPFAMASNGVPVLAQPTSAILNFVPTSPGVFANVSMAPGPGGAANFFQNFSLGTLTMNLPNRYYSAQFFEMEDDAVIQSQGPTQQVMAYPPALALNVSGGQVGVTLALVQLLGNATQAVSTGTQEVYSHFLFTQTFSSSSATSTLGARFFLGTHYPCAWESFLTSQFQRAGVGGHATITPSVCPVNVPTATDVTVTFSGLSQFTLVLAEFSVVIGVGIE
jgi:hypothetical protein